MTKPRTYYRAYQTKKGEQVVAVPEHSPFRASVALRKVNPDAAVNWPVSAEYYQKKTNGTTR